MAYGKIIQIALDALRVHGEFCPACQTKLACSVRERMERDVKKAKEGQDVYATSFKELKDFYSKRKANSL